MAWTPRTLALLVGVVAAVHALVWALVLPPFQAPDETTHVAYVQALAERGDRPGHGARPEFSSEQRAVMAAIGTERIIRNPAEKVPQGAAADAADAEVERAARDEARDDGGGASSATAQPPLFYALGAVVYRAAGDATLLGRVRAMRMVSVLCFALTAALCALLVAELLPGRRWAMLVGGLAVALQPVFAFASSAVNPDALLATISAAVLLLSVRVMRQGVTVPRAAVLGLLIGAGLVTKLTFLAVAVVGIAALVGAVLRRSGPSRAVAVRAGAAGLGAALVLPAMYAGWLLLEGAPLLPSGGGTPNLPAEQIASRDAGAIVSYAWQLYLPRLPGQEDAFGFLAPYHTWLQGLVGEYGWLDYQASKRLVNVGGVVLLAVAVSAGLALYRARAVVRARRGEVVLLVGFTVSLLALIALAGFDYRRQTGQIFEQARYLLPVAGLYGAAFALACAGAGARWAPRMAAVAVVVFAAHAASGITLTVDRYT